MNKQIFFRVLFFMLGIISIVVLFFVYLLGYIFGPLAFNLPTAKPRYLIDMFLYKEYFVIGLIHLSLLISTIISFVTAFKPSKKFMHISIFSYISVVVLFVIQIFWSRLLHF